MLKSKSFVNILTTPYYSRLKINGELNYKSILKQEINHEQTLSHTWLQYILH